MGLVYGILTSGGNPVANTTIQFCLNGQLVYQVTTNSTGNYSLTMPANKYDVTVVGYSSVSPASVIAPMSPWLQNFSCGKAVNSSRAKAAAPAPPALGLPPPSLPDGTYYMYGPNALMQAYDAGLDLFDAVQNGLNTDDYCVEFVVTAWKKADGKDDVGFGVILLDRKKKGPPKSVIGIDPASPNDRTPGGKVSAKLLKVASIRGKTIAQEEPRMVNISGKVTGTIKRPCTVYFYVAGQPLPSPNYEVVTRDDGTFGPISYVPPNHYYLGCNLCCWCGRTPEVIVPPAGGPIYLDLVCNC